MRGSNVCKSMADLMILPFPMRLFFQGFVRLQKDALTLFSFLFFRSTKGKMEFETKADASTTNAQGYAS